MQLFSGSSNQNLTDKIADSGGIERGEVHSSKFSNNECRIQIKSDIKEQVGIVQSFSNPVDHHIIEFCLIADALKRGGATQISAVIPWLGYSKQDKVFRTGEPLSVKVIANIIQTTPIKKIITLDLHNPAIMGFFDTPLQNIRALPLFVNYFQEKYSKENCLIVSPDAGAVKSSAEFANQLGVSIAYVNKKRDLDTGEVIVEDIDRDISGKNIIILDDMIATGSTMLSVAQFLKVKGALSVTIAATHHLYLDGVQQKLQDSLVDQVVVTNSIQIPKNTPQSKLDIIDISRLIAQNL